MKIVTLRGSARGSILENLPQHGEIMLSISKICPLCVQKVQKSSKISAQTLPKPPQNPPKATPNLSRSPLGAHFEPMVERSSVLNAQKTAKRRPKAPKEGPRRPQTPPKYSPRPSQNWFLLDFWTLFVQLQFCIDFSDIFSLFFSARTLKNYGFPTVKPHFSQNRHFPG